MSRKDQPGVAREGSLPDAVQASDLVVPDPEQATTGDEPSTLVRNSAWNFVAQGIGYGTAGVVSIIAIRSLSAEEWGNYATAIALISLLTIFSELGLSSLAMREMSARPADQADIFGLGIRAVIGSGLIGVLALLPLGIALGYDASVLHLLALGAPAVVLQPLIAMVRSAFNARRRLVYVAQFQIAQALVFGVVALSLLAVGLGASGLVIAIVVGNTVAVFGGLALASRRLRLSPAFAWGRGRVWQFMRSASPIAIVGGMAVVYDRLDVILLSKLTGPTEVALYSVPYTLAKLTWAIPSAIGAAFFPLYTRIRADDPDAAPGAFFLMVRVFTYISITAALFLTFAGRDLLTIAFGQRYASSSPILTVLAWSLVASFQNYVLWYGILAAHRERAVVPIQVAGLVVNATANVVLIPRYGAMGSAWAFLLSDLVTTGGQFVLIHRHVHAVPVFELVARPVLACSVAAVLGVALAPTGGFLAAATAIVAAGAILQVLGYVTREEWQPLTGPTIDVARRLIRRIRSAV